VILCLAELSSEDNENDVVDDEEVLESSTAPSSSSQRASNRLLLRHGPPPIVSGSGYMTRNMGMHSSLVGARSGPGLATRARSSTEPNLTVAPESSPAAGGYYDSGVSGGRLRGELAGLVVVIIVVVVVDVCH
jgi:hypothetical protein